MDKPRFSITVGSVTYKNCYFYTTTYPNGNNAIYIKSDDNPLTIMIVTKDYNISAGKNILILNNDAEIDLQKFLVDLGLIYESAVSFKNSNCNLGRLMTEKGLEYFGINS